MLGSGCIAPRILPPRHRTRNTPSLVNAAADANDDSVFFILPSFLRRERARQEEKERERIDEIRNADHGRTIGINLGREK